ncbi:MAG: FAD-binding oxidoreductase [Chthonomonadales bacterium]
MTPHPHTLRPNNAVVRRERAFLPQDRLERVWAWGMAASAMSYVWRPSTVEGVRHVFQTASTMGIPVGLRGSGRSYGDASLNAEGICLDLSRLNRILEWDPASGVIRVEAGVTIGQLWQYVIEDGWWPAVVPGTMFPTIAGCAAMNVHGKNQFKAGTIGDHILEFELMLPDGAVVRCSRSENAELFHAAIGGFGMLGCFTSLTLDLKRVRSGLLRVEPIAAQNLHDMLTIMEERRSKADYLVAWVDCFATGAGLGRGLIHQANYLGDGEDPFPAQSLRVENQELPDTFLFGLVPKVVMWRFMKPFVNPIGMRFVNFGRHLAGRRHSGKVFYQSHAAFAFLLDYVPDWKKAYLPGGLIQYQAFIPHAEAEAFFREQIALCQHEGLVPFLGVLKRHRPDDFLMSYLVDGWSLALDFRVTPKNRQRLWDLCAKMDAMAMQAGGRFYFAKDLTLSAQRRECFLAEERVQRFLQLKRTYDPKNLLQTDLYRRVFGSVHS